VTLNRVWIPSPNYSSRGGAAVRLIVIHTAEGSRTIESLGNFFANPGSGVSSHAGADDKANTVGEYVTRGNKSWTAASYNPVAVQIELCGFAAWTAAEWHAHPNMLANCAAWIAEEAAAFGIPIVRLNAGQAQGSAAGVCQHVDLGSGGGGHVDCGPGFPMDEVLAMAGGAPGGAPGTPPASARPWPGPQQGDPDMFTVQVMEENGAVYVCGPELETRHLNPEEWGSMEAAGFTLRQVNRRQLDVLNAICNHHPED
jgi:hypothetical protein